jgi:hypothetical protein
MKWNSDIVCIVSRELVTERLSLGYDCEYREPRV